MLITPVVLSDGAIQDDNGKMSLIGVFTKVYYWTFPFSRSWSATIIAYNFTKTKKPRVVKLYVNRGEVEIASKILEVGNSYKQLIVTLPISVRFLKPGKYTCGFKIDGYSHELETLIVLEKREMPKFTRSEVNRILKSEGIQKEIDISTRCSKCSAPYAFNYRPFSKGKQEKAGVLEMPTNGLYQCEKCDHELDLNDIKAQVLSSIKKAISRGDK